MRTDIAQITPSFADAAIVKFDGPKGIEREVHAAAAVIMGGKALAALKNTALESALHQAANGRYRAASEILSDAFPKVAKPFVAVIGAPSASKNHFGLFVDKVADAAPGKNGWTKKQATARLLVQALIPHVCPERAATPGDVVDAEQVH